MVKSKNASGKLIFQETIASIGEELYSALKENNPQKLEGLQCLGVLIRNWTRTSSGSALLSYLIRKTNEINRINKSLKKDGKPIIPCEFSIYQIKKEFY